jgi:hypothetical protein
MYGTGTATGGATALAVTGLAVGSQVLLAIGILMAGILLIALVSKNPNHRP